MPFLASAPGAEVAPVEAARGPVDAEHLEALTALVGEAPVVPAVRLPCARGRGGHNRGSVSRRTDGGIRDGVVVPIARVRMVRQSTPARLGRAAWRALHQGSIKYPAVYPYRIIIISKWQQSETALSDRYRTRRRVHISPGHRSKQLRMIRVFGLGRVQAAWSSTWR
jgi:hypothetical protein